jgi:hypothetical protein
MVAGAEPYGNLKNAALAVKGERIAWIGRCRRQGQGRGAESPSGTRKVYG